MDKITAHTLWMADVCWAHHFCFQTTHLMIIMLCLIDGEWFFIFYFIGFKSQTCTFSSSTRNKLSVVEPCRVKDCKIMLQYKAENNVTKQNKELPSIPLYTYYILPYPVTQRQALYPLTTFIIPVNINNTYIHVNKKRLPCCYYPEKNIWDMKKSAVLRLFNKVWFLKLAHGLLRGLRYTFLPAFHVNQISFNTI